MIYGLYLSASGVLANSYRQDVISNNLANAETVGFKRDLTLFRERLTAAQESRRPQDWSDPQLEKVGGGMFVNPTLVDSRPGEMERTGRSLDVAVQGEGYFAVKQGADTRLTRDGQFMVSPAGELILSNAHGEKVLNPKGNPIKLQLDSSVSITRDGTINQSGRPVAQLGLFDVANRAGLTKIGGNLMSAEAAGPLRKATGSVQGEFIERANVDSTTELAELMDAQRQLEANANMIRSQDEMLQRLVQDVGKIS